MKKNGCFARKKPTLFVDDLIKKETIPAREERERDGEKDGADGGQRRAKSCRTRGRHIKPEILIRRRAVKFKPSDIFLCSPGCSLQTNNRCCADVKTRRDA